MGLIDKNVGACLQAIQCVVTMRTILIACKQAPTRNIGSSHLERELAFLPLLGTKNGYFRGVSLRK